MENRRHLPGRHRGAEIRHAAANLEAAAGGLLDAEQQRGHADRRGKGGRLDDVTGHRRVHVLVVFFLALMRAWGEDREEPAREAAPDHARQVHLALAVALEEVPDRVALLLAPQAEQHVIMAVEYGYQVQPPSHQARRI